MNVQPRPTPLAAAGRRTLEIVLGVAIGACSGLVFGCVIAALVYPAYSQNGHTIADPRASSLVWYGGIVGPLVYAVTSSVAGALLARKVNLALGSFVIAFGVGLPIPPIVVIVFIGLVFNLH